MMTFTCPQCGSDVLEVWTALTAFYVLEEIPMNGDRPDFVEIVRTVEPCFNDEQLLHYECGGCGHIIRPEEIAQYLQ